MMSSRLKLTMTRLHAPRALQNESIVIRIERILDLNLTNIALNEISSQKINLYASFESPDKKQKEPWDEFQF